MKRVSPIAFVVALWIPAACTPFTPPSSPIVARPLPSDRLSREDLEQLARIEDDWTVTTTAHCVIRSRNACLNALLVPHTARALQRIADAAALLPTELPELMRIVVHPTRADYVATAKRDGADTDAAARADVTRDENGVVTALSVHLTQLTSDGRFDTRMWDRMLPHELCHLVLSDFCGGTPSPLYLQEGLAIACEFDDHVAATVEAALAIEHKQVFPLEQLLTATDYPAGQEELFCAQSYSFVTYLREQMTDAQFRGFLDELKSGYSSSEALHRALRIAHNEQLTDRLQQAWSDDALRRAALVAALVETR